ncbi:Hypothetical predicted protein [Xyrichtys novacula]|uniref:Uncharacterized protein n=1 Tax=Xyrichtys novacula TaxID=13765 RepID=A0AAV1H7C9_XYRNO|nr:Hypothetical predicted protein [Xyrichtys novacula]
MQTEDFLEHTGTGFEHHSASHAAVPALLQHGPVFGPDVSRHRPAACLPAVSQPTDDDDDDGDGRSSGLPVNPIRLRKEEEEFRSTESEISIGIISNTFEWGQLSRLAPEEMLRSSGSSSSRARGSGGLCRSGRGVPQFGRAPARAPTVEAI